MKYLPLIFVSLLPVLANATGMAVSINNLYIQNATNTATTFQIKNLPESTNKFTLPAKSICKVDSTLMFQPFEEESNNFAIMITTEQSVNPIVIDQFGLLTLASNSAIKAPYSGKVSQYKLFGFCGNKSGQYQFLNVTPHNNESSAPDFQLVNCSETSNYVYLINDRYIKVKDKPKYIDFSTISSCQSIK